MSTLTIPQSTPHRRTPGPPSWPLRPGANDCILPADAYNGRTLRQEVEHDAAFPVGPDLPARLRLLRHQHPVAAVQQPDPAHARRPRPFGPGDRLHSHLGQHHQHVRPALDRKPVRSDALALRAAQALPDVGRPAGGGLLHPRPVRPRELPPDRPGHPGHQRRHGDLPLPDRRLPGRPLPPRGAQQGQRRHQPDGRAGRRGGAVRRRRPVQDLVSLCPSSSAPG